ncbi:unnamed protein product, partial [Iphiclides podalirius]
MIICMLLHTIVLFNFTKFNWVIGELLPRFVIEDGLKNAIFGSYSYNPLSSTFETVQSDLPEPEIKITTTVQETITTKSETTGNNSDTSKYRFRRVHRFPFNEIEMSS